MPALLSTRLRDSELTSALEQARKKSDSFQSLGSAADVERSREPRDALALVKEVQGEAERLKAESKLLRTDRDQCRAELRAQAQREQQLRETHPSWPIPTKLAPEPLPLTAVVQPRASAKPLGSKGSYSFELWLDVPEDRAREIQRVTYVMDHPTFRQKELVSEERSTGFKTGYVGWGCLDSVDVTLRLANEKSETLNFDQCSAISHGESPGGVSPR